MRTRIGCTCALLLAIAVLLEAQGAAPKFKVDPAWPQEMPHNWILGAVTGVFVDAQDQPHGMSIDSKGNLYVGEASTGRRVQRFLASSS